MERSKEEQMENVIYWAELGTAAAISLGVAFVAAKACLDGLLRAMAANR
jgi:hypothetical protein